MKVITAAIKPPNVVQDVEVWDDSNPPASRSDGLQRVQCPEWVSVGCLYDGTTFTMPDGSAPKKSVTDAIAERQDIEDIDSKLDLFRDQDLPALKTVTGTNAERIARLEKCCVILYRVARFTFRLVKSTLLS